MKKVKKLSVLASLTVFGLLLSYVESLIPTFIPVPGVKLGLTNVLIVYLLYKFGFKEAIIVNIIRVLISALLFGTVVSLAYSLVGGILSVVFMWIMKKYCNLSIYTVSVVGSIIHNISQILLAMVLMNTPEIIYYLPTLLLSGLITGIVIGLIAALLYQKLEKMNILKETSGEN